MPFVKLRRSAESNDEVDFVIVVVKEGEQCIC